MTFEELYQDGKKKLLSAGIDEADLDASLLLENDAHIEKAWYYAHREEQADPEAVLRYEADIGQRAAGVPLQYLTGHQEFMGLSFEVNDQVLIPRQETEVLVETALSVLSERLRNRPEEDQSSPIRILDLGTGSGCVLLSILAKVPTDQVVGVGSDISKPALNVAKANGDRLGIEASWVQSDGCKNLKGKFDLIVSNPPYIPTGEIKTLMREVRDHEPTLALDGKEDGLFFYREILNSCKPFLNPEADLLFEIGSTQGKAVSDMMTEAGFSHVRVKKDMAGLDRVVYGRYD